MNYSIHFPDQTETPTSDADITCVYITAWCSKAEIVFTNGKTRKETALHRVLVSWCDLLTASRSFNFTVIQGRNSLMQFLSTNPDVSTFCVWICERLQPHPQPTHCSQILSYLTNDVRVSNEFTRFYGNHAKAIRRIYAYIYSKVSSYIGNFVSSFCGFSMQPLFSKSVLISMLQRVYHGSLEFDAIQWDRKVCKCLHQTCLTFYLVRATTAKFGLHADNMKFNTQNTLDRQCAHNVTLKARSFKYWCSEKAISITYSVNLFAALGIQHIMRMHHMVICGLLSSIIFFHIISRTAWIGGGELLSKMRVVIFSTTA
jgi:hypothetical protein